MSDDKKVVPSCDGSPEGCHGDTENCEIDPKECHANSAFANTAFATPSSSDSMDDCLGKSLDKLSTAFMASARRWEMIVYPSLIAFIILAAYGFFLIFSLTQDASRIADNMHRMTKDLDAIVVQMDSVSKNMVVMTQTLDSQLNSMNEMVYHVRGMNMSINQMRHDFSVLNNSVSRPMSFMNTFMPW